MSSASVSYLFGILMWAALASAVEGAAVAVGWTIYARCRQLRPPKSSCQALHVLFMIVVTAPIVSAAVIHWLTRESDLQAYEGANHRLIRAFYAVNLVNTQHWIYQHIVLCQAVWFVIAVVLMLRLVRAWLILQRTRCILGPVSLQEAVNEVAKQLSLKSSPYSIAERG